jgi:hypothetical protein
VGARPAEPCLRSLKEREGKFKTHSEKTKAEVSSDTYPLQGKANCACEEAPWALVSAEALSVNDRPPSIYIGERPTSTHEMFCLIF